mgnify:CR=1 FL=1
MLSKVLALGFLSTCGGGGGGSSDPPLQIEVIWRGVLNQSGADFAVFAMDVTTTTSGVVSGNGAIEFYGSGDYVSLSATGSMTSTEIAITLKDAVNDTIIIDARREGDLYRGTWRWPSLSAEGSVRLAAEKNGGLLSVGTMGNPDVTLREALGE